MRCRYNQQARNKLAQLLQNNYDNQTSLASISSSALEILSNYDSILEESTYAQIELFSTLKNFLAQHYNQKIYAPKTFWKKTLYFFGWLPTEEKNFLSLIKNVSTRHTQVKNQREAPLQLNWLEKFILHFAAKKAIKIVKTEMSVEHKLRYLSHRTLAQTPGTPKELEGSSSLLSFADYIEDIQTFTKNFTALDAQSLASFNAISSQLTACQQFETSALPEKICRRYLEEKGKKDEARACEHQMVADTSFKVRQTIVEMKVGESKLFPHGYTTKTGGHGTLFEVTKIDADQVIFRFINTGSGVDKVQSYSVAIKSFFSNSRNTPIKVSSPIPISSLTQSVGEDFIQQLISPNIVEASSQTEGEMKMVTPLIKLYNQRKLHDDKAELLLQSIGSCAHSRLDAWVETKLNKIPLLAFYIHRLQRAFNKIEKLLQSELLQPEQVTQCQRMRIAASIELQLLEDKLKASSTQLQQDYTLAIETLQALRVAKAANKGHLPKPFSTADIESYCVKKLDPKRLSHKFNEQDQYTIATTMPDDIKPANLAVKKRSVLGVMTLGFLGSNTNEQASSEDLRLRKTLLAKKILTYQRFLSANDQLQKRSPLIPLTTKEQNRVSLLVDRRRERHQFIYQQLDPEAPGTIWETLAEQQEDKYAAIALPKI